MANASTKDLPADVWKKIACSMIKDKPVETLGPENAANFEKLARLCTEACRGAKEACENARVQKAIYEANADFTIRFLDKVREYKEKKALATLDLNNPKKELIEMCTDTTNMLVPLYNEFDTPSFSLFKEVIEAGDLDLIKAVYMKLHKDKTFEDVALRMYQHDEDEDDEEDDCKASSCYVPIVDPFNILKLPPNDPEFQREYITFLCDISYFKEHWFVSIAEYLIDHHTNILAWFLSSECIAKLNTTVFTVLCKLMIHICDLIQTRMTVVLRYRTPKDSKFLGTENNKLPFTRIQVDSALSLFKYTAALEKIIEQMSSAPQDAELIKTALGSISTLATQVESFYQRVIAVRPKKNDEDEKTTVAILWKSADAINKFGKKALLVVHINDTRSYGNLSHPDTDPYKRCLAAYSEFKDGYDRFMAVLKDAKSQLTALKPKGGGRKYGGGAYTKTGRTHTDKKGVKRMLYERSGKMYVRKKSAKTNTYKFVVVRQS